MNQDQVQEKENSKLKNYIQTAGLLLILVILPLGSWYYLSSGLNYQRSALSELKDYGDFPSFRLFDQEDKILVSDSLKGNLILVSFFNPSDPETAQRFETLKKLHEQFDDRQKVLFIQHPIAESTAPFDVIEFAKTVDFEDSGQIYFLPGTENQIMELLRNGYKMPKAGPGRNEEGEIQFESKFPNDLKDYPYFILIKKDGKIGNYYDSRDKEQMVRLVEHMALGMPREK